MSIESKRTWTATLRPGDGVVQTTSGVMFDTRNPQVDNIVITDIATALQRINRFNGHGAFPYSVARHSVLVAVLAHDLVSRRDDLTPVRRASVVLWGLLHDAHEAYLGDTVSPLRVLCPGLDDLRPGIDDAIQRRYGLVLPEGTHEIVRAADREALAIERRDVLQVRCEWVSDPGEPATTWAIRRGSDHTSFAGIFADLLQCLHVSSGVLLPNTVARCADEIAIERRASVDQEANCT